MVTSGWCGLDRLAAGDLRSALFEEASTSDDTGVNPSIRRVDFQATTTRGPLDKACGATSDLFKS
jgi:hypothetical protein